MPYPKLISLEQGNPKFLIPTNVYLRMPVSLRINNSDSKLIYISHNISRYYKQYNTCHKPY